MSQGASLVIFVMATEAANPANAALERSARDVLGTSATVEVKIVAHLPSDEEAVRAAQGAEGAVELRWGEGGRLALLHCYLAREERWIDRTITFDPDDAEAERGRLLGFAVASMLLDDGSKVNAAEAAREPAPLVVVRGATPPERDMTSLPAPARARYALELAGAAALGIEGDGGGLGVSAGFRPRLGSSFWLRLGLAGRVGEVEAAQATTRSLNGSVGLVWEPLEASGPLRFGSSLRLDAVAGWLQVTHLSEDDPEPVRASRWQFAGDVLAEGALGLSENASLYAALGLEATAGTTELYTHGTQKAVIPVLRLVGELGARSRF